ncbi:hypothetical protein BDN72DRAFT_830952 [Pluteus cervinus]|uniref:Uncharacterized protein n=1 Tax=Pluteus cervinus TaxID=181527 RepID=A0ACD3BEC0_9AGAR|nr:hypothetical protein BDN72DRAFT_830952 [Pluteus cervinus]
MLLPDARMQISFLKDLATLRSPSSPITFLSYLHSQNRLLAFINRGSSIPTRKEYADYLSWAASFVQGQGIGTLYGHEVVGLAEGPDGTIEVQSRNLSTHEEVLYKARDLIISPGGSPRIPATFSSTYGRPFFIHSSSYVTNISQIIDHLSLRDYPLKVAVIGSGQSAAEVTLDLRERLHSIGSAKGLRHNVEMIIRKGSLKPSDDSPFANEIFDPSETDAWFSLSSKRIRQTRLAEYRATNYGVVNPRTLDTLFEIMYDQKVEDNITSRIHESSPCHSRITIRPYSNVVSARTKPDTALLLSENKTEDTSDQGFTLVLQNQVTQCISEERYHAIVCATGYERTSWIELLRGSTIGKQFGLHSTSSDVHLVSVNERRAKEMDDHQFEFKVRPVSETSSPSTGSSVSTPPTSPGLGLEVEMPVELCISRKYQLLPVSQSDGDKARPRVYLQGVEEATHGLSDSLLSVVGVRAGEVVEDICERYKD